MKSLNINLEKVEKRMRFFIVMTFIYGIGSILLLLLSMITNKYIFMFYTVLSFILFSTYSNTLNYIKTKWLILNFKGKRK